MRADAAAARQHGLRRWEVAARVSATMRIADLINGTAGSEDSSAEGRTIMTLKSEFDRRRPPVSQRSSDAAPTVNMGGRRPANARSMNSHRVRPCPCCATLVVDANLRRIVRHEEPERAIARARCGAADPGPGSGAPRGPFPGIGRRREDPRRRALQAVRRSAAAGAAGADHEADARLRSRLSSAASSQVAGASGTGQLEAGDHYENSGGSSVQRSRRG